MNLWKWDIKNGKVENCSCRDVPFTLWTIGNWFDGEKINERECKPSWNGSFNNMVDYEKDHPFADENGLVRDIVAQIPTCSFVGDCKPHCRETDPWYDPLIVPILGFPLLSLFILTSIAYFISCVVILRVCASSTHIFRKKKKATVNSNVHE
ncbi:unnamed protein product [Bursaphelenchus xylophilus]|uniref:(pine wood nematode) hypothetical protein n=1 Tax=Bursaphelenchus xylophilus TaxID=6326 RepID=A0A7I8X990_BURXY|nr:unnamed protein product [Bursaphelenchus xylophilus]CAG9131934.1 unnamed protein product [Bursaphelenchus xylophilus]